MIICLNKKPAVNDIRVRRRFAFIPLRLHNGCYVWLQRYYIEQRYCERTLDAITWWKTLGRYVYHPRRYGSALKD